LPARIAGPDETSWATWSSGRSARHRELAVGVTSASRLSGEAEWEARGDAINDEALAAWRALPLDELLTRARTVAGELRGHLTVVPEARWLKDGKVQAFFASETIDHYADHAADLAAILAAAR
jgi:hypothetical protein